MPVLVVLVEVLVQVVDLLSGRPVGRRRRAGAVRLMATWGQGMTTRLAMLISSAILVHFVQPSPFGRRFTLLLVFAAVNPATIIIL